MTAAVEAGTTEVATNFIEGTRTETITSNNGRRSYNYCSRSYITINMDLLPTAGGPDQTWSIYFNKSW